MLLRHSHTSPFVRKVMVLAHEAGLAEQVAIDTVDGWSEPAALTAANPLSMVPTLVLADGTALFDSRVICEYLDAQHAGPPLIPTLADAAARWRVLREQALADGILDAAVLIFVEQHRRPASMRWDWWLTLKRQAIGRALDTLEHDVDTLSGRVDLGTIAIAVALSYLDLRGAVGAWRTARPHLGTWHADFATRPSMIATEPPN